MDRLLVARLHRRRRRPARHIRPALVLPVVDDHRAQAVAAAAAAGPRRQPLPLAGGRRRPSQRAPRRPPARQLQQVDRAEAAEGGQR